MNPELQNLPLQALVPTPDNPRVLREDVAFHELVESIKAIGVLQPVIARPVNGAGEKFDLRAGHRRLAAAKKAGLATIPCIVREMDDRTAMEVTVSENLQRENLHPLEESVAIQLLLDVGWEIPAIADRLGKTPAWVARRARLRELSAKWQKAIADPKADVSVWSAGLLEVVARLPGDTQDAVLEYASRHGLPYPHKQSGVLPTVAELSKWVAAEFLQTLAGAPWKLDDDSLVPEAGSCTNCQKRSSCQLTLFDDLEDLGKKGRKGVAGDRCLDHVCYARKGRAVADRKLAELKAEHGDAVPFIKDYHDNRVVDAEKKRRPGLVVGHWNVAPAKAGEKGAKPAVIVAGPGIGTVQWIKQHNGTSSSGRGGGRGKRAAGQPLSLDERKLAIQKRREAHVLTALREQLDDTEAVQLPEKVLAWPVACSLAVAFGTQRRFEHPGCETDEDGRHRDCWKLSRLVTKTADESPERATALLVRCVLPVLCQRLHFFNGDQAHERYSEAVHVCELLSIDLKALEAAAVTAIPDPKAWAKLEADASKPAKRGRKPAKRESTKPAKTKQAKRAKRKGGGATSD